MMISSETPPCYVSDGGKKKVPKGICGAKEMLNKCGHCGFNPEENERRKQIEFSDCGNGLKRKIIRRGESCDPDT